MKYCLLLHQLLNGCRSPCGERGLKSLAGALSGIRPVCRSPCGERGLKLMGAGQWELSL